MEQVVLVLSTLDTKGPETLYLRDRIQHHRVIPMVLDLSMSSASPGADISSAEVAKAAGTDIETIRASRERKLITRHPQNPKTPKPQNPVHIIIRSTLCV